ncbi:MAG TPA: nucleoside deaminase [Pseudonocardiaceae bacterium]|nr:nucleoside deaminase [Pseudonocardiaceae bacterium]
MTRFWDDADPAWRECFELAWESFRAGSIPIGAVLVDEGGVIVARGRNRSGEAAAPGGQIAGSNVAHAELNALAALPPGEYRDHVLYTTLEPCFLCTAALRHSHVGTVRYAAPDPVWAGVTELPGLNEHLARRWTRRDGPLAGPLRDLAATLHLVSAMERGIEAVVDCHQQALPDIVRIARKLTGPTADDLRRLSLSDALGRIPLPAAG